MRPSTSFSVGSATSVTSGSSYIASCSRRKRWLDRRGTGPYTAPPMARSSKKTDEEPGIDSVLDGLEGVVEELESGELPLEKALARFEEGVRLARQGTKILDAVEERVEVLLADRDEAVPMEEDS